MFCSKCGKRNTEDTKFCRQCGADLENTSLVSAQPNSVSQAPGVGLTKSKSKDPDEMIGNGIGRVIIGDGFFMVAVILGATNTAVSSLLWLFLLIPAFFFFGTGFAEVFHARQIRRRLKQAELGESPSLGQMPPAGTSFVDAIKRSISGELAAVPSVTERTTRDLK